ERIPLDKLKQEKQILEWQRDDYRAMNTLLLDFRTELTQMKLTTKYRARTTASTNEERVTATASSAASQASYSITKVSSLASAAYRVSGELSKTGGTKIDATKSLASQKDHFAGALTWSEGAVGSQTLKGNGATTGLKLNLATADGELIKTAEFSKMSVKVNGVTYNVVDPATTNPLGTNDVKINANGELTFGSAVAADATVKVEYITDKKVQSATLAKDASTFQLDKTNIVSKDFKLTVGGTDYTIDSVDDTTNVAQLSGGFGSIDLTTGKITFTQALSAETSVKAVYKQEYADLSITSQTSKGEVTEKFLIQSSDSLNQVINKVNASNAGVSMMYDSFSDKLSLTRTETGNFSDTKEEMGISGSLSGVLNLNAAPEVDGKNAVFVINGLETQRTSNTFDMNGVTFTLKQTFTDNTTVNVSINNDGNQVFENIKSFVDKYNELIGKINGKISEERYRSYTPLTDEQREQLTDKQQEQWEEKAKSGLLRRDSILTSALSAMRGDFYQPVSNSDIHPMFRQLASIGITTTSNYLEGGKLEINESKLKEAINNNPEAVEALFRGGGDSGLESEKGIIHRLYDSVNETMDKLKARAGNSFSTNQQFTIGRNLRSLDDRIDRFEDRLKRIEDRYWSQFTAMEKAIQRSNEQSMFLMNQFG
ncbi:MAG TPA: flagellar filament capping protein FliD, partial [Chondromyces sp.]|nr:flagellar filament capping protein FliD [Chondromyces sp.]